MRAVICDGYTATRAPEMNCNGGLPASSDNNLGSMDCTPLVTCEYFDSFKSRTIVGIGIPCPLFARLSSGFSVVVIVQTPTKIQCDCCCFINRD